MLNPASFEIVTTSAGATSIRDNLTREIMHNPVGPWVEANSLYIDQSRLAERLVQDLDRELVIFDVGLGAAANALAVLTCARGLSVHRPLRLVSFEREMKLLEFALDHADHFAHFTGFEPAVRAIQSTGRWSEPGITWELRLGDYNETIARETSKAHLIFFEPYSPKKNADMWTVETFARTRRACDPGGCVLYTYSQATGVRAALLCAGFFVGAGAATGLKEETTQAGVRRADLDRPFGPEWLARWGRSHAADPVGARPEDLAEIQRVIRAHPQFHNA